MFKLFLIIVLLIKSVILELTFVRHGDIYATAGTVNINFLYKVERTTNQISVFKKEIEEHLKTITLTINESSVINPLENVFRTTIQTVNILQKEARSVTRNAKHIDEKAIRGFSTRIKRRTANPTTKKRIWRRLHRPSATTETTEIQNGTETEEERYSGTARSRRSTYNFALFTQTVTISGEAGTIKKINNFGHQISNYTKHLQTAFAQEIDINDQRFTTQTFINYMQSEISLLKEELRIIFNGYEQLFNGQLPSFTINSQKFTDQWISLKNISRRRNLEMIDKDMQWIEKQKIKLKAIQDYPIGPISIRATLKVPIYDQNKIYELWQYQELPIHLEGTNSNAYVRDNQGKIWFMNNRAGLYTTKTETEYRRECHRTGKVKLCHIENLYNHVNDTCLGTIFDNNELGMRRRCRVTFKMNTMFIKQINETTVYINSPVRMIGLLSCGNERIEFTIKGPELKHVPTNCIVHTPFGDLQPEKKEVEIKGTPELNGTLDWLPITFQELQERLNRTSLPEISFEELRVMTERHSHGLITFGFIVMTLLLCTILIFLCVLYHYC